ncbi:MAG: hypothetical protein EOL89_04815 [Actinobacteria bacterium]|nr:hypothetical protein [Actinomycetota bacterium]
MAEPTRPTGPTPRILGLETEYGLIAAHTEAVPPGTPNPLTPAEAVVELYRGTPQALRSRNRFLPNGGRLYVDLGSHPEYATAECRSIGDVVAQDRAGELILRAMAERATAALAERGVPARVHVLKNNRDSSGNSFGCHENYLVRPETAAHLDPGFVAFLATRPLLTGGGALRRSHDGAVRWTVSARAPVIHRVLSPDPTRVRPMVLTRAEPHADHTRHARLQVTHGDSNVSDTTTALKLGLTTAVLDLVETGGTLADLALDDPVAALHAVGEEGAGAVVVLEDGREMTARDLQEAVLERVEGRAHAVGGVAETLGLARRALDALRTYGGPVATELDHLAKHAVLERYVAHAGITWDDPRLERVELAYHDLTARHGLADRLRAAGHLASAVTSEQVGEAIRRPPADTRAALRGAFVAAVEETGQQASISWTHVRLDSPPRPQIDLLDPFQAHDDAVAALVEEIRTTLPRNPGGRSGLGWLRTGLGDLDSGVN